jgi:prophage regulatory protein
MGISIVEIKYNFGFIPILRKPVVLTASGVSNSQLYDDIAKGMYPSPIKIRSRAVGWPADEVAAVNAARIAGLSDNQIKNLVEQLLGRRKQTFQEVGSPQ